LLTTIWWSYNPDERRTILVDQNGEQIGKITVLLGKTPYEYDFHLLADNQTINAFALPADKFLITYAYFSQLNEAAARGGFGP